LITHIGGESLLNDGSAIVFYSIFSQRYFAELGVEGFGSDIDLREGVALFCQKALGGAAVGVMFGIGMLAVLSLLNRRLSKEENITQVMAVLAIAYLNYYVADFVWKTSGVIATLVAGLLVRFLGRGFINDIHLLDSFFALLENMLNTVLFSLGGLVFGYVIVENKRLGVWEQNYWGYLILLYVLLTVIRGVLFVAMYPITVRIGLKTNWAETFFQVYGGLRGAVGIALAISLDNDVAEATGGRDETIFELQTAQLYQMVGGVAFLTLVINGTTAGPLLRKLGLANATETRKKMVEAYKLRLRAELIDSFVELLTNERFKQVDFGFVKHHVPFLSDLTLPQLAAAVATLKDTTSADNYNPPYLHYVLPYLRRQDGIAAGEDEELKAAEFLRENTSDYHSKLRVAERGKSRGNRRKSSTIQYLLKEPMSTNELRLLFISMVRSQYERQVVSGELESQQFLTVALLDSLDCAEDDANQGKPLNDFQYLLQVNKATSKILAFADASCVRLANRSLPKHKQVHPKWRMETYIVEQAMAFVDGHKRAQSFFQEQLGDIDRDLSEAGKIVLAESQSEIDMADLNGNLDNAIVQVVVSKKFCKILLNKGIRFIDKLVQHGLLKESEAEEMVESIEHLLAAVIACDMEDHMSVISKLHVDEEGAEFPMESIAESPSAEEETNAAKHSDAP
jgi:NhaP-type Na+/H+ or K+/H+ antiporter